MLRLQKLRELCAFPLPVNSGYRCEAHNASVGGKKGSYHLLGRAADIACHESYKRAQIVEYAMKAGLWGIGLADSFVHVDDRGYGQRRIWLYD